jgi:hypothetical protein
MKTGHKTWVITGGHIPLLSTGTEPEFTSRDTICLLNTNKQEAKVSMMIYYEDEPPAGPYKIELAASCVRHIRFNDLVDPLPIALDKKFAAVIECDMDIVVQFTRMDTSQDKLAGFITMAYAGDN